MITLADNLLLRQAELRRMDTVDVDAQGWIIQILRDEYVRHASGEERRLRAMAWATRLSACRLAPLIWMSIGAGAPMLTTASTRLPVEKYAVSSGISCSQTLLDAGDIFVAPDAVSRS